MQLTMLYRKCFTDGTNVHKFVPNMWFWWWMMTIAVLTQFVTYKKRKENDWNNESGGFRCQQEPEVHQSLDVSVRVLIVPKWYALQQEQLNITIWKECMLLCFWCSNDVYFPKTRINFPSLMQMWRHSISHVTE